MRYFAAMCFSGLFAAMASTATAQSIDVADYFLQTPEIAGHYTIGGINVHTDRDPDGSGGKVLVLDKFGDSDSYEVYRLTPTQLQLRYEVFRPDPRGSSGDWIRQYRSVGPDNTAHSGALWMPRYVTPGQTSYLVHYIVDRYEFDPDIGAYIIDAAHSENVRTMFDSIVWTDDPWGSNNHTGIKFDRVFRLVSQWQPEGQIFERYDYARGLGLVHWQWLERISTLTHLAGDTTGKIFHCENGTVYIQSPGTGTDPPSVLKYDLKTHQIGAVLPVVLFTSYWKPELGPQWYVVYRDLAREGLLEKKKFHVRRGFALPEWRTHLGATLADLPHPNIQH